MVGTKNTPWKKVIEMHDEVVKLRVEGEDYNGIVADLQDWFCGSSSEKNVLAAMYLLHQDDYIMIYDIAYSVTEKLEDHLEFLFPERKEVIILAKKYNALDQTMLKRDQDLERITLECEDFKTANEKYETLIDERDKKINELNQGWNEAAKKYGIEIEDLEHECEDHKSKITELKVKLYDMMDGIDGDE